MYLYSPISLILGWPYWIGFFLKGSVGEGVHDFSSMIFRVSCLSSHPLYNQI